MRALFFCLLFFFSGAPNGLKRSYTTVSYSNSGFVCRSQFVLTVPEADSVPVTVEGLEVLLVIDPLSASRTNGQTSSS